MTTTPGTAATAATPATPITTPARPLPPKTAWKRWLIVLAVAAATVWCGFGIGVNVPALIDNIGNGVGNMLKLLHPDFTFFPHTLTALTETVEMAVMGTAVASAVGLPLSFLASRVTNPNRALMLAARAVMNIDRAVPDLLYAAILVSVVGVGVLSGTITLILFDAAIVVKLVSEALDAVDRGGQEAARAAGASWVQANRAAVLPQILPNFLSQVIYTFELNIRVSTVIGLVGAGGLGMLIDKVRTFYRYGALSLIILEILVVIILLEALSSWVRGRLVQ